jgi:N6-L-threonylcarbamoyladenine synthase
MKNNSVVLGIDTSNYTTSVAIVGINGELIANLKMPLRVKEGERGLRQSDALFSHTVNIPQLMKQAGEYLCGKDVVAIGVSEKPRNVEGSYMPCFLAGVAAAESIAQTMHLPLYRFSHQCGHVMAALYSSKSDELLERDFAAFHISGGTTELVRVRNVDGCFQTELVGGTADLNAGQVIDRIGVYLGMPFPAGPHMEQAALTNTKKIPKKKLSVNGMKINLSGLENMAITLYKESNDKSLVAAFVFDYVARAISAMIDAYETEYGKGKILCAGGVMCNRIIKDMLSSKYDVAFAEPAMSADNAVGCACLALRAFKSENNCD